MEEEETLPEEALNYPDEPEEAKAEEEEKRQNTGQTLENSCRNNVTFGMRNVATPYIGSPPSGEEEE